MNGSMIRALALTLAAAMGVAASSGQAIAQSTTVFPIRFTGTLNNREISHLAVISAGGGSGAINYFPGDYAPSGNVVLSSTTAFSPTASIILGINPGVGAEKPHLMFAMNQGLADQAIGVKFSETFSAPRHSELIALLSDAYGGDAAAEAALIDFLVNGEGSQAGFAPGEAFTVVEFSSGSGGGGPIPAVEILNQADLAMDVATRQMLNIGTTIEQRRQGRRNAVMLVNDDAWYLPQAGYPADALAMGSMSIDPLTGAPATAALAAAMTQVDAQPMPGNPGVRAVEGGRDSNVGGWASVRFTFGDLDNRGVTDDTAYLVGAGTLGIDYRFTDRLIAGIAFGLSATDTDMPYGGSLNLIAPSVSLYATWAPADNWYVDGTVGYTYLDYSMNRGLPGGGTAQSDPDGNQIHAAGRVGYDFQAGGWSFGPFGGLEYIWGQIDGYTETGAGPFNLSVGDQAYDSLQSKLGGQAAYAFECRSGVWLVPQASVAWVHEFLDDSRSVDTLPAGGGLITLKSGDPTRDFIEVRGGASVTWGSDWSAFIEYAGILANDDYSAHSIAGGLRLLF